MDPLTRMVSDFVIDDSTCLHTELKDSLAVIMKQDIAKMSHARSRVAERAERFTYRYSSLLYSRFQVLALRDGEWMRMDGRPAGFCESS